MLHPADTPRHRLDRLDIVADRLFARDFGERAEDRGQETGQPFLLALDRIAVAVEADRAVIGLGVDLDETPVDLAARRPLLARRDPRSERRVGEHVYDRESSV